THLKNEKKFFRERKNRYLCQLKEFTHHRNKLIFGTIYFSLVSVVLAASPANLLPNISVSNNAIF
ncbi:hypothetical protein, partial [Akkermansia sp.]|uniref:hypothetical protein n=1 Tax=Akkermansia sp. TaxID=1872421 RepID=UPI003AAEF793